MHRLYHHQSITVKMSNKQCPTVSANWNVACDRSWHLSLIFDTKGPDIVITWISGKCIFIVCFLHEALIIVSYQQNSLSEKMYEKGIVVLITNE